MIKDIVEILQKMESSCPVECFTHLRTSLMGNLVLEWRWVYKEKPMMYCREITIECDGAIIDPIGRAIHLAGKEIAHKMGVKHIETD